MLSKRRSSSSALETTDQDIIKQGNLIKSPPYYAYTNKSSWKKRYFILWKTPAGNYRLTYYTDNYLRRGSLEISEITGLEMEVTNKDRLHIIKMSGYPECYVLNIKTSNRDYFLVDNSKTEIQGWYNCVYEAWKKMKPTGEPQEIPEEENQEETMGQPNSNFYCSVNERILPQIPQEEVNPQKSRNSYPENHPSSEGVMDKSPERERSHTDPVEYGRKPISTSDLSKPEEYSHPFTSATTIRESQSSGTSSFDGIPEPDESDEESERLSIYDYPRRVSKISLDPQETSDYDDGIYEHMGSVQCNPDDEEKTPPQKSPKEMSPKVRGNIKTQGSKLKKTYVIRMMFDATEMVKTDITVSTEHLKTCIAVEEVGDRLCVCKWKGPKKIGCLFYHGDQIFAINDMKIENRDSFLCSLRNIIANEVKLTVIRNPKADVFHLEGCTCLGS
ncbi:pleckstrin homology domain-containing family S member 1 [Discoglossus pictus]